ncbi:TIR domain-containing protein [Undibacterium sp. CY21W]|uniref:TIR domain-containing protein n=1 Tax=Undibacterium sp. CY21W TaxID=2762293 RepID=UPI00164C402E|nr:TIR domain-containing protein [Undibacterium sp. CY21W]MBC3926941.1 TIR domain-containing protein [Undibacterium sp. CY21W]
MNPQSRAKEVHRLITAFEHQAAQFHDLTFSIEYIAKDQNAFSRPIKKKHHGIFLWQFVGLLGNNGDNKNLVKTLTTSDLTWGVPNAELTCLGIIEGEAFETFVAMAKRAGSIFTKKEAYEFKTRMLSEIIEAERAKNPTTKAVASSNDNPLAIWLNFLLFFVSKTHPGRELSRRIEPDPFALSLLALEYFQQQGEAGKMTASFASLSDIQFKVALSFPGEKRSYVEEVARNLKVHLGENSVFYDFDYQAYLCHPSADIILQNVYHRQSEIVVVFLCAEYAKKEWCGLELRAIRDLIKTKQSERIIIVKFDDEQIDGFFSIDGYLDAKKFSPSQISEFILQNLKHEGSQSC